MELAVAAIVVVPSLAVMIWCGLDTYQIRDRMLRRAREFDVDVADFTAKLEEDRTYFADQRKKIEQSATNTWGVVVEPEVKPHEQGPELPPVEPTMDIANQINAGLADLRTTLVAMAQGGVETRIVCEHKAKYQLELIVDMIDDCQAGKKQPWSDRKLLVEEEFS